MTVSSSLIDRLAYGRGDPARIRVGSTASLACQLVLVPLLAPNLSARL